jgi:hypothetical protein
VTAMRIIPPEWPLFAVDDVHEFDDLGALSSTIEPLLTRPGYRVKGDIIANLL